MRRNIRAIHAGSDDDEDDEDDDYYSKTRQSHTNPHAFYTHSEMPEQFNSSEQDESSDSGFPSLRNLSQVGQRSPFQTKQSHPKPTFSVAIHPSSQAAKFHKHKQHPKPLKTPLKSVSIAALQAHPETKPISPPYEDDLLDDHLPFKRVIEEDDQDELDIISPSKLDKASHTLSPPKSTNDEDDISLHDAISSSHSEDEQDELINEGQSEFLKYNSPNDFLESSSPVKRGRGRPPKKRRTTQPLRRSARVQTRSSVGPLDKSSHNVRNRLRNQTARPSYDLVDYSEETLFTPPPTKAYPPSHLASLNAFASLPLGIDNDQKGNDLTFSDSELSLDLIATPKQKDSPMTPSHNDENAASSISQSFGQLDRRSIKKDDPFATEEALSFDNIGGLEDVILQLKEMVLLPLLYPEVFLHFHITPPRGVLFHGPPGTGKTLMARALAANCSIGNQKVSFFLRKGSDCLSKWVGEAERQLRLLFEEAKKAQPSIIFFDEIDGLAPIRTTRQDQTHSSIVSTLLALMDGLDSRGQVVVIGATNRPNDIDSALRRPGRFDREFYFSLPSQEARMKILKVHTKHCSPSLSDIYLSDLAAATSGYGGADLKALCTEAALQAVRRCYPQIYHSSEKYLISPDKIQVDALDFERALEKVNVSTRRGSAIPKFAISDSHKLLFKETLDLLSMKISHLLRLDTLPSKSSFFQNISLSQIKKQKEIYSLKKTMVYRPRLIITGHQDHGQSYLSTDLFRSLDGVYVQCLDISQLLVDSEVSPNSSLINIFASARHQSPSIIFINNIEQWPVLFTQNFLDVFTLLLNSLIPMEPVLLVGVANTTYNNLPEVVRSWFPHHLSEHFELSLPSYASRKSFFMDILKKILVLPLTHTDNDDPSQWEQLPKASTSHNIFYNTKDRERQERVDNRRIKNKLKIKLLSIMDLLRSRYKKFKKPIVDLAEIYPGDNETEPSFEVAPEDFPFFIKGNRVIRREDGATFNMMNLEEVDRRIWSGFYCTPHRFLRDLKLILEDVSHYGDLTLKQKAKELYLSAELNLEEMIDQVFMYECQEMEEREARRRKEKSLKEGNDENKDMNRRLSNDNVNANDMTSENNIHYSRELEIPSSSPEDEDGSEEKEYMKLQSEKENIPVAQNFSERSFINNKSPSNLPGKLNESSSHRKEFELMMRLTEDIAEHTSNLKMEWLDLIYSRLSNVIWDNHEEMNRIRVLSLVKQTFSCILKEIRSSY
ncbi:ATPase with bromodomain protein [Schizosaccharomyces cryophilus OY26]|uniref:ATPase with bromodomain protein n=1 Tax=Schizosaccharomyces cryophilus (strain OY26 / ATCC MYA-4695 / CBS 11777 / NBRC 106824 / NRRL Y48691) TaxID=653667 RepID=S9WWW8_SCHCR|nr:ATPase with bromodomain protein [Schizosaccharomyces cryophilus OY26]EPY49237.1 ATPase with bromodomain protein [Schizosaccharomyces cryophilus OY26]